MQKFIFFIGFFIFLILNSSAQNHLSNSSPDQLYADGIELLQQGNYGAARQVFENYIALAESNVLKQNATYYVAYTAISLYHKDGESLLSEFIDTYPNHPKAKTAYYELGNFYYKQKKYKKAVNYFEKADFNDLFNDDRHVAYFKKGYAYFTQRNFDNAINSFDQIKTQDGQYKAAASYYAGYIEYQNEQYDLALTDLQRAEKDDAYKSMTPYMISNVYYKQKEYQKLQQYAVPLLSSDKKLTSKADISLLVAEAYFHQKKYDKANEYFSNYKSKSKPAPELSYRMGYAAYMTNNTDRAIEHFKRINTRDSPLTYQSSYYLAILYNQKGEKQLAITSLGLLLSDEAPANLREEAVYQLSKLHYETERTHEAITLLKGYLSEFPSGKYYNQASTLLTQAYFNDNDYDEAIKYIATLKNLSLEVKKVYQKAAFHKGVELYNKEQYTKAIGHFDQSLAYPYNKEYQLGAYYWKGESYATLDNMNDATKAYQKVLWDPASNGTKYKDKVRYGLGYAYFDAQQYEKALVQFREYLKSDTKNTSKRNRHDATIRLADCYYVSKDYRSAINFYKKAIDESKVDNDYCYLHLALVESINGNQGQAIRAFDEVINRYRRSKYYDDALYNKAQLFFENGQYNQSINTFSKLIKEKPKSKYIPYALMKRASAFYNTQDYTRTINDYESIINQYANHSITKEVLIPLQEALNQQGKSGDFDQYLARYKKANPDEHGLENVEFEAAKSIYFNLDYQQAIAKFNSFIASYPSSSLIDEAKYYLAESYYRLDERENALNYYNQLVSNEQHPQYHRILGRIAELEFKQQRYENATYFYHQYRQLARSKKHQFTAYHGLMECFFLTQQYDSSKVYAQHILDLGGVKAGGNNKALLTIAKSSLGQGNFASAKEELLSTINTAKDEYGAQAQYLLGKVQYQEKDYEKSIETLISLNSDFHAYEEWVGRGFLLIADNYVAMNENKAAIGTLESIIEGFPREDIVNTARAKIQVIQANEIHKSRQLDSINAPQDTLYTDQ